MQAVRFNEHGDHSVLDVVDVERPEPASGELLVQVTAAGINPVDTYFRDGSYSPVSLPFTPGVDLSGVVAGVGTSVEGFEPGDRVYGTGIGNDSYQGSCAEYVTVPDDRIAHLPDNVDFRQAGGAGVVGVTAWRALIDHATLDPGSFCLVHGGSGGVGHVAVQLGAAVSARVIATARPKYHETLRAMGAETVLTYDRDDLVEAIRDASNGGVDTVLDHRLDDYLQLDAAVAAEGATVVGIGENSPDPGYRDVGVARSKDVQYRFMSMFNTPDLRVPLQRMAHLMATDTLRIEFARTYDLKDVGEAHRAMMEDSFLGKLVIEP